MHFSGRPVALRRLPRLTIAPNPKKPPLTAQRFLVRHQNLCYEIRKSGIRAELKRKSGINQKGRKQPNGKTFNLRKLVLGKGVLMLSII